MFIILWMLLWIVKYWGELFVLCKWWLIIWEINNNLIYVDLLYLLWLRIFYIYNKLFIDFFIILWFLLFIWGDFK